MTVKELIENLQRQPQDAPVLVCAYVTEGAGECKSVKFYAEPFDHGDPPNAVVLGAWTDSKDVAGSDTPQPGRGKLHAIAGALLMQSLLSEIDTATAPSQMSKAEALEFLERLLTELECRCDALRDEISND